MDKINSRIAQVYGYAVCFICVIIILVSTHSVIDAAFDYSNPAGATGYGAAGPLSSYEVWRVEFDARRGARPNSPRDSSMTEKDLRRLYESQRAEQLDSARFRALRSLVSSIVFLALATAMFLLHWRWIRRANREPLAA
ncbi:MAG: hypothetical protein H0W63_07005 [Gemmatimonadaceae bacterium]|nr:hypothetical protein [Gemmatimonadaceae bacterium]